MPGIAGDSTKTAETQRTRNASQTKEATRNASQKVKTEHKGEQHKQGIRFAACSPNRTVWPSGLRRWLQAPVRKGVGSNPTAVISTEREVVWQAELVDHLHEVPHRLACALDMCMSGPRKLCYLQHRYREASRGRLKQLHRVARRSETTDNHETIMPKCPA